MKITLPNITPGLWTAREGDVLNPIRPWGVVRDFTLAECQEIDGEDAVAGSRSEVIAEICGGGEDGQDKADAQAIAALPELLQALAEAHKRLSVWSELHGPMRYAELLKGVEAALLAAGCKIES